MYTYGCWNTNELVGKHLDSFVGRSVSISNLNDHYEERNICLISAGGFTILPKSTRQMLDPLLQFDHKLRSTDASFGLLQCLIDVLQAFANNERWRKALKLSGL